MHSETALHVACARSPVSINMQYAVILWQGLKAAPLGVRDNCGCWWNMLIPILLRKHSMFVELMQQLIQHKFSALHHCRMH